MKHKNHEHDEIDITKIILIFVIITLAVVIIYNMIPSDMDIYTREYARCITANLPIEFCKKLAMDAIR